MQNWSVTNTLVLVLPLPDARVFLAEVANQLYGAPSTSFPPPNLVILDDYYHSSFHFCEPEGGPHKQPESLGSILFGDRIFDSPYDVWSLPCHICRVVFSSPSQIQMLADNGTCRSLCVSTVPAEDAKFINERIREDYALNWLIDGLPAAEMKIDMKSGDMFFDMGFNLGNDDDVNAERPVLNNHYDIVLRCDP